MQSTYLSYLNIDGDSIVTGAVPIDPFVPRNANLFPKMTSQINMSAWELWEFDAFSASGETAVTVSFYRDARGLEKGGFHIDLNAIWPDGQKWGEEVYFPESIITAESDSKIHGVWKSSTASVSFNMATDLSTSTVQFDVPGRVNGVISVRARGKDRESYLPANEASAMLGPVIHYMFPMGPAEATTDMAFVFDAGNVSASERKLCIDAGNGGRGSMVRGWSAVAFPDIMTDAYYLSAAAGPYALQLIRIVSAAATNFAPHAIARLYKDEKMVCAAQQLVDAQFLGDDTLEEDAVVVDKVLDGDKGLSGEFQDKNRGYVVKLVEAQRVEGATRRQGRRWRFETNHKLAWWSEPTSAPGPQGTGKSGWIEFVFGGSEKGADDKVVYQGAGIGGQLQLQLQ